MVIFSTVVTKRAISKAYFIVILCMSVFLVALSMVFGKFATQVELKCPHFRSFKFTDHFCLPLLEISLYFILINISQTDDN